MVENRPWLTVLTHAALILGVPALLRTVMRYTGAFETESATAENAAPGPGDIDGHSMVAQPNPVQEWLAS